MRRGGDLVFMSYIPGTLIHKGTETSPGTNGYAEHVYFKQSRCYNVQYRTVCGKCALKSMGKAHHTS